MTENLYDMNLYDLLQSQRDLNVTINAGQLIEVIDYAVSKREAPQRQQATKKDTYGINEVAERTGYTVATIYAKVHKRQIPFHKSPNGSKLVFFENEISDWLDGNVPATPEEVAEREIEKFNEKRLGGRR